MSDLEKYILENREELDRMEAVPEEAIWQRLRGGLPRPAPARRRNQNWRLLSAALLLAAAAGWGLWYLNKPAPATVAPGLPPQRDEPAKQAPAPPVGVPIAGREADAPIAAPRAPVAAAAVPALPVRPVGKARKPIAERQKAKQGEEGALAVAKPTAASEEERRLQHLVAQRQREIGLDSLDRAAYNDLLRELDELEVSVAQARADFGGMPQNERLLQTLIRYYELKIRILEQISKEINKREYHEALEKRI